MLQNLFRLILDTWWVRDLLLGLVFGFIALLLWRQFKRLRNRSNYVLDDERGDQAMFESAIDRGLAKWQADYLRGSTARELHKLVGTANKAAKWGQIFGLIALIGAPLSSLVTGAGVSMFGLTSEQLSFWVTSIASAAAAISAFMGFDQRAIDSLKAARRMRAEVFQFIGSALEYKGLELNDSFQLLTDTLELMLEEVINAESAAAQAKREAAATNSKPEKDETRE